MHVESSRETVKQCLFFLEMYNKTVTEFGFCDMRNYQGLGKCYQPRFRRSADNTYLELDNSAKAK